MQVKRGKRISTNSFSFLNDRFQATILEIRLFCCLFVNKAFDFKLPKKGWSKLALNALSAKLWLKNMSRCWIYHGRCISGSLGLYVTRSSLTSMRYLDSILVVFPLTLLTYTNNIKYNTVVSFKSDDTRPVWVIKLIIIGRVIQIQQSAFLVDNDNPRIWLASAGDYHIICDLAFGSGF